MVGGANIIDKINCETRIGCDVNEDLITLLKYVQSDNDLSIVPDDCSFEHYSDVRENWRLRTGKYSQEYTALIGYCASYGGRYFDGGYARSTKVNRNMYAERVINLKKQAPNLTGIEFRCCDYKKLQTFENCLFYFDPPYNGTKQYLKQSIDYEELYDFCRGLSQNNIVLISEYNMPNDFKCIWQKERKVLQKSDRLVGEKATEKLFIATSGDHTDGVSVIKGELWQDT